MQAGSPQQLLSFSAPLSLFIYSLIHCENVKCWFCTRPCAGAFAMFSYNVRDREDNWAEGEGVAVNSWVCGDHGAGAGTESRRQADRYRALIMSPSCLAQNSPTQQQISHPAGHPSTPLGILSQQSFCLCSLSISDTLGILAEPPFPLLRPWISLEKPHPWDGPTSHSAVR